MQMSKKRALLVTGLIILILLAIFLLVSSLRTPKTNINNGNSINQTSSNPSVNDLEPLPASNTKAIENEINKIDQEIDSMLDEDITDFDDLETSLE